MRRLVLIMCVTAFAADSQVFAEQGGHPHLGNPGSKSSPLVFSGERSKPKAGIGFNLGAIVNSDENVFYDVKTDLYPEMTLYIEDLYWRTGMTVGFIYRSLDSIGWWGTINEETIIITPIMARFDVRLSPIFFGTGVGYYASLEDGPPSQPAVSFRFGMDIISNSNITIMLDARYEHTFDEPQLGGVIATVGGYLKILD